MRRLYHASLPRVVGVVVGLLFALFVARVAVAQHAETAPTPSVEGSVTPAAPSASVVRPSAIEVRVRDRVVFVVRAGRGGRTGAERARAANTAIEALLAHPDQLGDVRFEEAQGTAVIYVGKTPVLTLGPEDVEATGEASLGV